MRLPFLLLLMAAAACCQYMDAEFWSFLLERPTPPKKKCDKPGVISQEDLNLKIPDLDNPHTEAKITDDLVECGDGNVLAFIDSKNHMQFSYGRKMECKGGKWHVADRKESMRSTRVCCKGPSCAMQLIFLLLLVVLAAEVASYKILVYNSQYGHSHSNFLWNIADILVDAGHDMTSFIPVIDPEVKDGTSKSKKVFVPQSQETKDLIAIMNERKADFFSMDNFNPISLLFMPKIFASQFLFQCRAVLEDKEAIKKFQAEKFDVMFVENFDMCAIAYSHLVKPKSLITSSGSTPFSYMFEEFGVPLSLSYNPSSCMSTLNVHSMFARAKNMYAEFLIHALFYPGRWMIEELYREKFGQDFPSLQEISSHAAYTFTNSEPLIDFAAPTLNRYWNEVLSRRSKTILLSFGSVAKSVYLPVAIKQSILTTIGSFPEITFIWKYEELENDFAKAASASLPNLVLSSWMPQNDLLNDERITVFITHGGMGSTQETAIRGKPGIFIPIFGDQPRNAGMMQHNGFGKVIDKFDLHKPEVVIAAIKDVLSNDSYRKNAARVSKMLAKKPFSSKEQLIKTIEFAAEYGPSRALRPQSYDMTFIEYHNLDIIAAFLVLSLLSLFLTKKFLCCLYCKCFGGKKCAKKDEKKAQKKNKKE